MKFKVEDKNLLFYGDTSMSEFISSLIYDRLIDTNFEVFALSAMPWTLESDTFENLNIIRKSLKTFHILEIKEKPQPLV